MKVSFYATLRDIAGQKTVDFDIPEKASVRLLVDTISRKYPLMRDKLLLEDGSLRGYVHVFINGRDVRFLERQLETVIEPDDTITVFPAVGGG
jgi:molybdopterin synthase sulfur carrier subunit